MTARLPLQPQPLSAAIADRLRQHLLQGRWQPGADLQDGDIAQQFGVSRTPVREAMKQLCHEGLLTAHPRRGMTVSVFSPVQIAEAQTLQALLQQHIDSHPSEEGSLAQKMLLLAQQRLQLAQQILPKD